MRIDNDWQSLLDDYLVHSWRGVTRVPNAPTINRIVRRPPPRAPDSSEAQHTRDVVRFGCPCSALPEDGGIRLWHTEGRPQVNVKGQSLLDEHSIVSTWSRDGISNWSPAKVCGCLSPCSLSSQPVSPQLELTRQACALLVAAADDLDRQKCHTPQGVRRVVLQGRLVPRHSAQPKAHITHSPTARLTLTHSLSHTPRRYYAGYEGYQHSRACLARSRDGLDWETLQSPRDTVTVYRPQSDCWTTSPKGSRSFLGRAADTYVMLSQLDDATDASGQPIVAYYRQCEALRPTPCRCPCPCAPDRTVPKHTHPVLVPSNGVWWAFSHGRQRERAATNSLRSGASPMSPAEHQTKGGQTQGGGAGKGRERGRPLEVVWYRKDFGTLSTVISL